jgi:TonB family protein
MSLRVLSFLAFLAVPCVAASAAELRAPTSAWRVKFDDSKCLASRDYGTPERRVQLVLKAPAIGDVVQVAIIRKAPSRRAVQLAGRIRIDGGTPVEISMLAHSPAGSGFRAYLINMPSSQFALVRQASELSVKGELLDVRLSLSQMAPLMKLIDECVAGLRRVYNVTDPAAGESSPLPRRARANLARLISNDDYPVAALSGEQSGVVRFVLLIDEAGRVADCTVTGTSGVATLDAQTCAILKERARFEPAVGTDGKPAKDAVSARIVWAIRE